MAPKHQPTDEELQLQVLVRLGREAAKAIEAASRTPTRELIRSALSDLDDAPRALAGLLGEAVVCIPEFSIIERQVNSYFAAAMAGKQVEQAFAQVQEANPVWLTTDEILSIGRIRGEAQHWIFNYPKYDADGVAKVLGSEASNSRQTASRLRLRSELLGLPYRGAFLYPAFQFDPGHSLIWPIVAEINKELRAQDDPWGVASFWFGADPLLGQEPYRLAGLADREDDLRRAVRTLTEPAG